MFSCRLNFISFLLIVLIVSITPANANLIGDSVNTLQSTVQIQQNKINQTSRKATDYRNTSQNMRYGTFALLGSATVIGIVAAAITAAALLTTPVPPISAIIFGNAGLCAGIAVLLGIAAGVLYGASISYDEMADKLMNQATLNMKDLGSFTEEGVTPVYNMNVSTFNGIPIIKKPPMNNWKDLQVIIDEKPKHGDLLMGPGSQFLYGPYEGFVGEDQFKYTIIENGRVIGSVIVKVSVKPIPVLNIPKEG